MISFVSFPARNETLGNYDVGPRHPAEDDGMDMDLDEDEFSGPGTSKVTCPGEALTSAQDFMRYVSLRSFGRWHPNICRSAVTERMSKATK